jgi:hypothetical protein
MNNKIIIRSVFKITRAIMEPALDPVTNRYPDVVRRVDSKGDMIITDKDRESGRVFIAENERIEIYDGKEFDLEDPYQAAWWDAIKTSRLIATERSWKDHLGNLVIDGDTKRYGTAEFYVERPGKEAEQKVTKEKSIHNAKQYIFNDTEKGLKQKVKLLGHTMDRIPLSEIQTYLLDIATKTPDKIINIYTGGDTPLRILLIDALDKKVVIHKGKQIYQYGESTILGATTDSVLLWMKNPQNKRLLDMIKAETYPDLYDMPTLEEAKTEVRTEKTPTRTKVTES